MAFKPLNQIESAKVLSSSLGYGESQEVIIDFPVQASQNDPGPSLFKFWVFAIPDPTQDVYPQAVQVDAVRIEVTSHNKFRAHVTVRHWEPKTSISFGSNICKFDLWALRGLATA